jgi:hypothetical protein
MPDSLWERAFQTTKNVILDDVAEDLRNVSIRRWRIKALNRVELASIVKKAKAKVKAPKCYRNNKKKKKKKKKELIQFVKNKLACFEFLLPVGRWLLCTRDKRTGSPAA